MESKVKKNRKRKKNRSSFLANARGFGKRGIYGRGTVIDDEDFSYFVNVMDTMRNSGLKIEDKVSMANNVIELTEAKEIHLASNQIVSKVLEGLISFVDARHLERFFNAFASNFRPICSDRFASHVLQKMVEVAFLRAIKCEDIEQKKEKESSSTELKAECTTQDVEKDYNTQTKFLDEHRQICGKFLIKISSFLLNNLEDFVWDPCANHIMRTSIFCLSGIYVNKVAFEKEKDIQKLKKIFSAPEEWIKIMMEYPTRLEMWPQFHTLPYKEHSSALLSCICIALKEHNKDYLIHFGNKIICDSFLNVNTMTSENDASSNSIQAFDSKSCLFLLETLLSLAEPMLFKIMYEKLFVGRTAMLAGGAMTKFSVQKLLQNIEDVAEFEKVFLELACEIENLLRMGVTEVVAALSSACLRLSSKQSEFVTALKSAFHLSSDNRNILQLFFKCALQLKPHEVLQENESSLVDFHGSLIVQDILRFNKPIFLVNAVLDTSSQYLCSIFKTSKGSFIADAFMLSKYIGEKSRDKLVNHMKGCYTEMAITKFGSRVVERLFFGSPDNLKICIVKELAEKVNLLKTTPFGNMLYAKFRVNTFQSSMTQWILLFKAKE